MKWSLLKEFLGALASAFEQTSCSLDILGGSTATSRLGQSGDKSPHSKTLAQLRGSLDLAPAFGVRRLVGALVWGTCPPPCGPQARAVRSRSQDQKERADSREPLSVGILAACLGVATGFLCAFPIQAWVVETPLEFITEGDFDGDGRVDALVVDKESGAVRVAFQTAAQDLNWRMTFASGIANATSIAVGRIASTNWDSIAVTAPAANRINRLDPRDALATTGVNPVAIYPPGMGPNLVAGLDAGGAANTTHDDYFVVTGENPGSRRTLLRNDGSITTTLTDGSLTEPLGSPNAFEVKAGQGKRLGALSRLAGRGFDTFQILDFSVGVVSVRLAFEVPLLNAPERPEFVAHRFDPANALGQVLFYRPGDTALLKYQVRESVPNLVFINFNRFSMPGSLQILQPLALPNGGRLLGFFGSSPTNLTNATIFNFDGVNPPTVVQSLDGNFSGAVALGGGHLTLLNADGAGRSASFQILLSNGAGYTLGARGALPRVTRFSGAANALLFDAEPFVNAAARPRQLQQHADWSTALRVAPTVRVTGQEFLGSSNGLGSASTRDFGAPSSGVTTGLVNQYTASISVFSGRPAVGQLEGEVRIAPPGGHYGEAQRVSLITNAPGWQVRYRTAPTQNWLLYSAPFWLISNATVEFYGRRLSDGALTAMGSASYTFNLPIGELDSDHDGVPDYVEQSRGLDPRGGADSDGDGFSDLEELARGTSPRFANSFPADSAGLRAAFNRLVSPRPPHPGTGVDTRPRVGVSLRAFTLGGSFLGSAVTHATNGTGATNPAALFLNLLPEPGARLMAETTFDHYDINAALESRVGRELIGLFEAPFIERLSVDYVFGGGSLAAETANWIAAASSAVAAAENPTLAAQLTVENSLVAALFERQVARALVNRGNRWGTNATLFPFRAGDAGRHGITAADLAALEQYAGPTGAAYAQRTVFEHLDREVRNNGSFDVLRRLTRELWRISAAEHNANEGQFPLPYDELRRVVAGQSVSAAYGAFKSIATNLPTARAQAAALLSSVPERPRTNVTLVVATTPPSAPIELMDAIAGTPVTLWRFDGAPCTFPPNLQLLPGTRLSVFGHTDLSAPPGTLAVEVISVGLAGFPMPSPEDLDGNLLADSWEELFLGAMGADAFADRDGDGYSNLQEMLAGTSPDDRLGLPGGPILPLTAPVVELVFDGAQLHFVFSWPGSLANRFRFGLEEGDEVTGPFVPNRSATTVSLGGDQHEVRISPTAPANKFYRLTVKLE